MNKELCAYQEAGQAVASYMLRREYKEISLDDGLANLVDAAWFEIGPDMDIETRKRVQEEATILQAGREAVGQVTGVPVKPLGTVQYLTWMVATAGRICRRYDFMPMVEAVARRLMERGALGSAEVEQTIKEARARVDVAQMEAHPLSA